MEDPQVYDLELTPDWHQIALFNTGKEAGLVSVRRERVTGREMPSGWMQPSITLRILVRSLLGKLPGTASVERTLDPIACAMISVRKVQAHPQVLSTSRHVLQGWVDLSDVKWDAVGSDYPAWPKLSAANRSRSLWPAMAARRVKVVGGGATAKLAARPAKTLTSSSWNGQIMAMSIGKSNTRNENTSRYHVTSIARRSRGSAYRDGPAA